MPAEGYLVIWNVIQRRPSCDNGALCIGLLIPTLLLDNEEIYEDENNGDGSE